MHAVQGKRRVSAVQERTDVEGRAGIARDPVLVDLDDGLDGLQRIVGIKLGQAQTLAGAVQTGDVLPGAEELHAAVGTAVSLHALEDLGAVVQDARGRGHRDGAVGHDARVMPTLVGAVVHQEHMIGEHGAEAELVGRGQRAGMGSLSDRDIHKDDLLSKFVCSLDFLEMLHVVADALAAGVEGGLLVGGQRQLDDLLDAVFTDDAGNTREQALFAVLAAQLRAGRENDLFVVQHGVGHARGGGGNAVLGAELAGERDPAAANGLLLQRVAVEAEALVGLGPLIQRHAAEADAGPGRELLVAVLAHHVAGDGLVVKAGLARQRAQKTGGVEARAGAEHAAAGQAQMQCQLARDDVAGVGDVDEHAVKAAGLDLFRVAAHSGDGEVHLGHAVMRAAQQVDLADAVDDDVAHAKVGEVAAAHRHAVGHVRDCVAQILHFACELLLVLVDEHQLVRDALDRQSVSHMCADMTHADHAENSFLCHKNTSFLKNGVPV